MTDLNLADSGELTLAQMEGLALIAQAEALVIDSNERYAEAGEFLVSLKQHQGMIVDLLKPGVEAAHKAHKAAVATRERLLEGPKAAERSVKAAMAVWDGKVRDQVTEASAKAEAERKALQADADRRLEEARAMDRGLVVPVGAVEAAEPPGAAQVSTALSIPVLVVPKAVPALPVARGVTHYDKWTAKVTNFRELVQAWLDGKAPEEALMANQAFLDDRARRQRDAMDIPGVEAVKDRATMARRS